MDPAHSTLLVVGAGTLGMRVARGWLLARPDSRVVAETRSEARHARIREIGGEPHLRAAASTEIFANVLFSVPPSATSDYVAEAARAARLFAGEGRLVMASSTAVYAESSGGRCAEGAALATTERAARLLAAEAAIQDAGGIVVRLAGLYDFDRGPQRVYLRHRQSSRRPDGLVNLVHYDDAASLCTAALLRGERGCVYLGSDDHPITRRALLAATLESGLYDDDDAALTTGTDVDLVFGGTDGPLGRRCSSAHTRQLLGWAPQHESFIDWLRAEAT